MYIISLLVGLISAFSLFCCYCLASNTTWEALKFNPVLQNANMMQSYGWVGAWLCKSCGLNAAKFNSRKRNCGTTLVVLKLSHNFCDHDCVAVPASRWMVKLVTMCNFQLMSNQLWNDGGVIVMIVIIWWTVTHRTHTHRFLMQAVGLCLVSNNPCETNIWTPTSTELDPHLSYDAALLASNICRLAMSCHASFGMSAFGEIFTQFMRFKFWDLSRCRLHRQSLHHAVD